MDVERAADLYTQGWTLRQIGAELIISSQPPTVPSQAFDFRARMRVRRSHPRRARYDLAPVEKANGSGSAAGGFMWEGANFRYILLCRHARHLDGNLLPVKNSLERWEYPTDSVGRVLAEELAIRAQEIRLGKIVWADTNEAKQTAALLLNRLANRPAPSRSTSAPEFPEDRLPQPPEREEGETERPSHLARLVNRLANRPAPSDSKSTPESPEDRLPQLPQGKEAEIEWPSHLPEPKKDGDAWRRKVPCDVASELSPTALDETTENMATHEDGLIAKAFNQMSKMSKPGNALLIIGHQPQLGRLTACLTRRMFRRRRGVALPLSSSEILCLRSNGKPTERRWKLLWTIAPDDAGPLAELAEKVKGKMESAKLLSAVITLALAALLGTLLDTVRWDGLKNRKADLPGLDPYNAQLGATIAFVLLLTALAVYLVTMYSYDRLLMPTRFWGESPGRSERAEPRGTPRRGRRIPRRPPSSSAWVVYRNMQLVWFALFTPANVLVALAFATLAAPLLGVTQNGWWFAPLILAVVAFAWSWWWRPVVGSED